MRLDPMPSSMPPAAACGTPASRRPLARLLDEVSDRLTPRYRPVVDLHTDQVVGADAVLDRPPRHPTGPPVEARTGWSEPHEAAASGATGAELARVAAAVGRADALPFENPCRALGAACSDPAAPRHQAVRS